ncbi:MAG: ACT domain-containing protein [Candidatus Anammoxibacter sp.]
MSIEKQLTILLENKPGELSKACSELATKDINILAISVSNTIDLGLTRMVVSDHARAKKIFEASGLNVIETDVLAIEITDKPGRMAEITRLFYKERINIEYAYASVSPDKGKSLGIFWVSNLKKALEIVETHITPK